MITTINFNKFCDSFSDTYKNNFTFDGKRALFDYLEEYEDSTGEKIELDPIALCCEYTEFDSATEAASEYFAFEGMKYGKDGEELETSEQVHDRALEFLSDSTTVIECDNGHIIIQDF